MTTRQVSRVLRMSDKARADAALRAMQYQARCRAIDEIVDGAKGG